MNSLMKVRCRAVIIDNNELLVIRNNNHEGKPANFLALPGGHLDPGETPREGMAREIEEELGVKGEVGRLLCVYTFVNEEGVQSVEFFFEITNASAYRHFDLENASHGYEIAELLWVSPGDDVRILPEKFAHIFHKGKIDGQQVVFLKG